MNNIFKLKLSSLIALLLYDNKVNRIITLWWIISIAQYANFGKNNIKIVCLNTLSLISYTNEWWLKVTLYKIIWCGHVLKS